MSCNAYLSAQVSSFTNTCTPLSGDSLILNAFGNGCINGWSSASGNPSYLQTNGIGSAVIKNAESIIMKRVFSKCAIYNFSFKVKLDQPEKVKMEITFTNDKGESIVRPYYLKPNYSQGWTTIFSSGILLLLDFGSMTIAFKGDKNTLFVNEYSITEDCLTDLSIEEQTISGRVQNSGVLNMLNTKVLNGDTALLMSDQTVTIKGESILNSGSEVSIQIKPCTKKPEACIPEIPKEFSVFNFLSPNGDGQNDTFYIDGLEQYPGTEVAILNNSGKQVFHSTDYKNEWNGGQGPAGIYSYHIRLKQGEKPISGELLLIR